MCPYRPMTLVATEALAAASPAVSPKETPVPTPEPITLRSTTTLVEFAMLAGRRLPLRHNYRDRRSIAEVAGPHNFEAMLLCRPLANEYGQYGWETPAMAVERVWAEFQAHLKYHATLDKMVRERMETDDAATKPAPSDPSGD